MQSNTYLKYADIKGEATAEQYKDLITLLSVDWSVGREISSFTGSIDTAFAGITTNPTGTKLINLGVDFTSGMAVPEINKGSGEVIFLDNRASIARNARQKEDLKIILEF